MLGLKRKAVRGDGVFSFRVSDVVEVPLRGTLLRLRLLDGTPSMGDLAVGSRLRLRGLSGAEREVVIKAHSLTGGRATQGRLDRTRELDVVLEQRGSEGEPVEIGWTAHGPVN
ncbi:MAG: hypothetical protein WEF86_01690 [Gemmatimonadota bacterium]